MKKFLTSALEGLYLLGDDPKRSREDILSNVRFAFPFPMYFMWTGIAAHLMLDFKWMNQNISESPFLLLTFWLSFTLTAYPFFLKFIYPLLDPNKIDRSMKNQKFVALFFYWVICVSSMILLAWLTNYTRADEIRQAF